MNKATARRLIGYPLIVGGFYLAICAYLGFAYVRPPRHVPPTPETVDEVLVPTLNGPNPTWASPDIARGAPKKDLVFVMSHGYGGTRAAWRGVMEGVQSAGYEVVVPAMPGQDASPDKSVGFGTAEARVIVETVHWVRSQYPSKKPPRVILLGVSLGGAASWLASERIPGQISAVITEGAFARFDETMKHWFDVIAPSASDFLRPIVFFAERFGNIDPSTIVPINAAAKWRKPALIIQAGDDRIILGHNATDLSRAAHAPLWVVSGASHAGCFEADKKGYLSQIFGVAKLVETQYGVR